MVQWAYSSIISLLQRQGSKVRIPVSPSSFLRECPEEKAARNETRSSRIVNERERDDVDIRLTGCKDDSEGGMRIRSGYEKWFGSFRRRLNGQRRARNDMERKIINVLLSFTRST